VNEESHPGVNGCGIEVARALRVHSPHFLDDARICLKRGKVNHHMRSAHGLGRSFGVCDVPKNDLHAIGQYARLRRCAIQDPDRSAGEARSHCPHKLMPDETGGSRDKDHNGALKSETKGSSVEQGDRPPVNARWRRIRADRLET